MELKNKKKETAISDRDGTKFLDIKGIQVSGEAIFTEGAYSVYVGYIESETGNDIPHYLIINDDTWVVEGSAARLFDARGMCSAYSKELVEQDKLISKGEPIVEQVDEPNGNKAAGGGKKWQMN